MIIISHISPKINSASWRQLDHIHVSLAALAYFLQSDEFQVARRLAYVDCAKAEYTKRTKLGSLSRLVYACGGVPARSTACLCGL